MTNMPEEEQNAINPEEPEEGAFEDIPSEDRRKILKLHAGLPVFESAPTYTGFEGEIVLHNDKSSNRKIYVYLGGTWYSVALT